MPISLTIHPMQEQHLDAVLALEHVSFPTPWPRSLYERELRRNRYSSYLVIVPTQPAPDLPMILGQGGFWLMGDEAHVVTIAVRPDWRGRGLGQWLMLTLLAHARTGGAKVISLEVRPSNESAIRLYSTMGFVQVGKRKRYYPNGEDALVLELADLQHPALWTPLEQQLIRRQAEMRMGVERPE